jgi:hypothetical protein
MKPLEKSGFEAEGIPVTRLESRRPTAEPAILIALNQSSLIMKTKKSKGKIRAGSRSPFRSLQRAEQKPKIPGPVAPELNCKAQAHYVAGPSGE